MRCTRPASVTTYSAKPPGAEAITRSPGLMPATALPTASTSPEHSRPSRAPSATRRSARLRLEARTRISTSFGFGVGFGRAPTSTPFSPKMAACMIDPPVALVLHDVVSLKPYRFQLFRLRAAQEPFRREPFTYESACPPEENWRVGLPARLSLDLRTGSRDFRRAHDRPRARRGRQRLYRGRDLRQGRPLCRARASSRPAETTVSPRRRQRQRPICAGLLGRRA